MVPLFWTLFLSLILLSAILATFFNFEILIYIFHQLKKKKKKLMHIVMTENVGNTPGIWGLYKKLVILQLY